MRVAIIGFGRFGRLLTKLLLDLHDPGLELEATSRSDYRRDARSIGVAWVRLEDAARADVLILCVPICEIAAVLDQVRAEVRPGALVMDTCSIKAYPAQLMASRLPPSVSVLATHPLFGPDGITQFGIAGQRWVSCPIRISPALLTIVEGWFEAMGVTVLRLTPEEHDRQIAVSQGLVHFIGRAVARAELSEPLVTTNNAHRLFELASSVANDSMTLFTDLETLNPYAAAVRKAFLSAAATIEDELAAGKG